MKLRLAGALLLFVGTAELLLRGLMYLPGTPLSLAHRHGPVSSQLAWAYGGPKHARTCPVATPDPVLGWVLAPCDDDRDPERATTVTEDGLRGPPSAPAGRRVAWFGDSFTFGSEVADDVVAAAILPSLLPDTQSLNLGVVGYDWAQVLLRWRQLEATEPADVVVLGLAQSMTPRSTLPFFLYAKPQIAAETGDLSPIPAQVPDGDTLRAQTLRTPHVWWAAQMALWHLRGGDAAVGRLPFQRTTALLEVLVDEILEADRTPVLLWMPMPWQLAAGGTAPLRAWMDGPCADPRVVCLDPTEALQTLESEGTELWAGAHYSAASHRVLAEAVAGALRAPERPEPAPAPAGP